MEHEFKAVHIYADNENNLILIAIGTSDSGSCKEIEIVNEIKYPYSDEQLEEVVLDTLEKCFTLKPCDTAKYTVLENYLGVKGYLKATKDRRLVAIRWFCTEGYSVLPSCRNKKGVYRYLPFDKCSELGCDIKKGDIANAIREALKVATC